jgi:serine/threonine protein kinase
MAASFTSQDIRHRIAESERELRQPGSVLFSQSRYEITRILGEGGMGITFLADELCVNNLRRPVVLKFVKDSLDPHRLTRFLNEVQLSIIFNHPNLVPVFRLESEVIQVEDERRSTKKAKAMQGHTVYYAVMQYIDGWNVRQIVNRLRSLGMVLNHDLTMFIISRIARGLHYVHEYRDENGEHLALAHRDVSPENILIDHFARIKVSDFGIALETNKPTTDGFSRAGNLLYCSPEQLANGQLDRRCDIYNIGLLMYLLFTDTDRFGIEAREDSPRERIRKLMAKTPDDDLVHVDPRLAQMCSVCLREDPDERYQTCEDLANDIDIYFKDAQKFVTNEQLEEVLADLFSPTPRFVSRRFVALTGSDRLEQPDYDPTVAERTPESAAPLSTVKLNDVVD